MGDLRFSEFCANCRKSLESVETILLVEKEIGRCFCSEDCIQEYFQPTVDAMKEEYENLHCKGDFGDGDTKKFIHYRALTLEEPDEVWMHETEAGDRVFTYFSQFRNGEEQFTYVCVCLTIEGIPSFIFLSFATKNEDLLEHYRKGTEIRLDVGPDMQELESQLASGKTVESDLEKMKEKEEAKENTFKVELGGDFARRPDDIPREKFSEFDQFIEPTLDDPDEIWSIVDAEQTKWLTFISMYRDQEDEDAYFSMVVLTKIHPDKRMEVIMSFPTVDPEFVQKFRRGVQSLNKAYGVGWTRGHAA